MSYVTGLPRHKMENAILIEYYKYCGVQKNTIL